MRRDGKQVEIPVQRVHEAIHRQGPAPPDISVHVERQTGRRRSITRDVGGVEDIVVGRSPAWPGSSTKHPLTGSVAALDDVVFDRRPRRCRGRRTRSPPVTVIVNSVVDDGRRAVAPPDPIPATRAITLFRISGEEFAAGCRHPRRTQVDVGDDVLPILARRSGNGSAPKSLMVNPETSVSAPAPVHEIPSPALLP